MFPAGYRRARYARVGTGGAGTRYDRCRARASLPICPLILAAATGGAYRHRMSERLPLFPLGTVLFPGLLLPLHIFDDCYRQLVHQLLDGPEPRRFGVIAIRKGRETGIEGVSSLYEVGCTATLRETEEHDDGRFDLMQLWAPNGSGWSGSTSRALTCRATAGVPGRGRG